MAHQDSCDHSCCTHSANKSVCQTLTEMDWERGIWNAAFTGDKDKVQCLIDKAKNPREIVNAPDNSGYRPLHYAARSGNIDICKMLMDYGADINAQTSGKATPLHKAAAAGKPEAVLFLIKSGARIEMQDTDGETALHKAAINKRSDVIKILLHSCPQLAHVKDKKGRVAKTNLN